MGGVAIRGVAGALGRRALQAVLVSFLIGALCFLLVRALPGDMAYRVAAGRYGYDLVDAAAAASVRAELGLAAASSRMARDATVAATAMPQFAFARLKGLSRAQVVRLHVLRNAAVPVVAYLGVQLALLVEGVVVIEILFGRAGIGHALVHAVFARDVPMVQGAALVLALAFVALNAATDLAVLALDPRRRGA